MAGKNESVMLLATMVIMAASIGISSAATYTVGGNTGWKIPPQPNFYSNWASQQTFQVGDVLVFNFPAGAHTVAEVSKANFDSCGTANTIGAPKTTSPASVNLTKAGTQYFICTVNGHCGANQKLAITVTGPSSAPTASPTPPGGASTPSASSPTIPAGGSAPTGNPVAEVPSSTTAPPPDGNFGASTSVGLLSLVSVAVAALMASKSF
ncbi:umecyanin-like [Amaranthus tricolor]|uniref:umecyanin-like n=1 Tax=Amaranthus tricolor TaxID=29722 RepID=UPI0025880821|nr:umecyanin-like [Amaranthus tricolor]